MSFKCYQISFFVRHKCRFLKRKLQEEPTVFTFFPFYSKKQIHIRTKQINYCIRFLKSWDLKIYQKEKQKVKTPNYYRHYYLLCKARKRKPTNFKFNLYSLSLLKHYKICFTYKYAQTIQLNLQQVYLEKICQRDIQEALPKQKRMKRGGRSKKM